MNITTLKVGILQLWAKEFFFLIFSRSYDLANHVSWRESEVDIVLGNTKIDTPCLHFFPATG